MISICTPSRGRPEKCAAMIDSMKSTVDKAPLDFHIYLNKNDPTLPEYEKLINKKYLHIGREYFANHGWNLMAKKAEGSILFMQGDAELMMTKGWDNIVFEKTLQLHKRIGVLVPDDGRNQGGAPHFMVTRQWYELMGYMSHPIFLHWYVDTYAVELAQAAGCLIRIPEIVNKAKKIRNDDTANLSRKNKITHRDDLAMEWARQYLIPMEQEKIERAINL
jgi:hypothetical protein|tara:strand:- start:2111 stop:2770 length:660 start_codon:yes stop_codon:yes gene_type:complete